MMVRNAMIHEYVTTIFTLKKENPFNIKIRLFVLINLSTNKTMFAGKLVEKNRKNRQKERISRRVLKLRRLLYLDNKLTEVNNNYTIEFVLSIRIFWYITRLFRSILKNDLIWPLPLNSDLKSHFFFEDFFFSLRGTNWTRWYGQNSNVGGTSFYHTLY